MDIFKFVLHSIIEKEEFAIMHTFTGSHQISGGKLKTVSQGAFIKSIVLIYMGLIFWYQKIDFLISENTKFLYQKSFSDIKNSNLWYKKKWFFWYRKIKLLISKNDLLISRIQIFDIKKYLFNIYCESDRMCNRLVVSGQLSVSDWLSNKTQQFIKQLFCNFNLTLE